MGGELLIGKVTFSDNSSQSTAGFQSGRNRIINGAMAVDQERSGAAVTPTVNSYILDQYNIAVSQASKLTFQQVVDAPAGLKNSLKITVAAQVTPGVGDFFQISQPIEGQNILDMQFGSAGASIITFSFS